MTQSESREGERESAWLTVVVVYIHIIQSESLSSESGARTVGCLGVERSEWSSPSLRRDDDALNCTQPGEG